MVDPPRPPGYRKRSAVHIRFTERETMESQANPYAPTKQETVESTLRPNLIISLLKKTLFTSVWTLVFFFGSAMILGFASGMYFVMASGTATKPSEQTMKWIGMSWVLVPMVLGPVGFLLSIFGLLPGTRWNPKP